MFKCQACEVNSKPNEKQFVIPMVFRQVQYVNDNKVSIGTEIVMEARVCNHCAAANKEIEKSEGTTFVGNTKVVYN